MYDKLNSDNTSHSLI